MQTLPEIAAALEERFGAVAAWYAAQPDSAFEQGPPGKWTTGQHLDHLIRSTKPLNQALRLPRLALAASFGKANRESRGFNDVVGKYKAALGQGGAASGRFLPEAPTAADKSRLIAAFVKEGDRLSAVVRKWSEDDADKYVLPHPLMGKLTVREMLFFTNYHMDHHFAAVAATPTAANP